MLVELLNEEEFGGDSETTTHEENSTNPAEDLGLMVSNLKINDQYYIVKSFLIHLRVGLQEENQEASMFFLQLPPTVPMIKRAPTANDQKVTDSSRPPGGAHTVKKACALNELPEGFMGKMLVYRSGAIKLKLGDTFYDVSWLCNKTKKQNRKSFCLSSCFYYIA